MKVYDAESDQTLTAALFSEFEIKDARFQIVFMTNKDGTVVKGIWVNPHIVFELNDVASYFDFVLPDCINFELSIESLSLMYASHASELNFEAVIRNFGSLTLDTQKNTKSNERSYSLDLAFDRKLELAKLPIIGKFCDPGDGFDFKGIKLNYTPEVNFIFSFLSQLVVNKTAIDVNVDYVKSLKPKPKLTALTDPKEQSKETIYWLQVDKSFSVLYFSRIGVSLVESEVKLYLDASFSIALLRLDFYELYVSTSLKKLTDIGFGLGGLMVSLEKPSFSLNGGLYKSHEDALLYNGTLGLRINQYSFQAIGSYGEMSGSGEKTFFAYLMLGLPLGGPPAFFVNGLAFGFGVNRSIRLPELSGIRTFPLVAAAMGESKELSPKTEPKQALNTLSEAIRPDPGQYFISAGIRFLTYGVLETFALLNIEMGNRLVISLLGLSNASIPPKVSGASPIVRAELAIKAVFDMSQGECMISAALTDRSFLFHPDCKLTGGFAIGFWFKGQYSGDFIVTLGGCHHPDFHNIHYPNIQPLGVSWIINDNISFKGEAYFALTPSCMMAGASLKLLCEWGALKAWCYAAADFILQWKPFYYKANVQVSIGASYRISFLGIGTTFKVEIGAGLTLWGPEFSGKIHVNWYIISFTIGFGANNPTKPPAIGWKEFAGSFIPGAYGDQPDKLSIEQSEPPIPARISNVKIADGLLVQFKRSDGTDAYVVDGLRVRFLIEQLTPCSQLSLNAHNLLEQEAQLGIVPMGLSAVKIHQKVTIESIDNEQQSLACLQATVERRNVPAALWSSGEADPNTPMLENMPVGMSVIVKDTDSIVHVLPERGAYEESVLSARETITRQVTYHNPYYAQAKEYPKEPEAVLKAVQTTIGSNTNRDKLLLDTAAHFGTRNQSSMRALANDPQAVLLAVPVLRTIGSSAS